MVIRAVSYDLIKQNVCRLYLHLRQQRKVGVIDLGSFSAFPTQDANVAKNSLAAAHAGVDFVQTLRLSTDGALAS
jgi:hypothetical protein